MSNYTCCVVIALFFFFFSSRRRHTRCSRDWSSDVCSSDLWSLRASVTSSLSLEDARVPASNMLPNVKGMKGPLSCLTQARYGIGWGAIGAAMACYHEALEYAKIRKQFDDRPVAPHQLVPATFADMITEITN